MPIRVTCTCGQAFAAQDQLAGKAVKCPKCGQSLRVPAAPPTAAAAAPASSAGLTSLLDEVGIKAHVADNRRRCPNCDLAIMDNAVVCVQCGFNTQTSTFVKGFQAKDPDADRFAKILGGHVKEGHGAAAVAVLKKAETAIKDDVRDAKAIYRQGAPILMLVVALSFIGTLCITMTLLPKNQSLRWSGLVLTLACNVVALVFIIRIYVTAFTESIKEGLLVLFVPLYILYYVATRWSRCGRDFVIYLVAVALMWCGIGLMLWAAGMKDEAPAAALLDRPAPVAVATADSAFFPLKTPWQSDTL